MLYEIYLDLNSTCYFSWYWLIGLVGRVFTNGPEDLVSILSRIIPKTLKMVLDTSLLNTQHVSQYISKVKWSNSGKGVAPSLTPQCSSYWRGSLQVALNYSHQLALLTFHEIYSFHRVNVVFWWLLRAWWRMNDKLYCWMGRQMWLAKAP